MRAILVMAAFGVMLVGCAPRAAPTRTAQHDDDLATLRTRARAKLVLPRCEGETEGVRACGLIADRFLAPATRRAFAEANCGGTQDVACAKKYRQAFIRELAARYDEARVDEVEAKCEANEACTDLDTFELAWLESHNAHVVARTQRELAAR